MRAKAAFVLSLGSACAPRVDAPGPVDDGTETGLLGNGPPPPGAFAPGATPLRRLTSLQYRHALADLFGPSVTRTDDLEPDTEVDGFVSLGAARTVPSAHGVDQYASAAYAVARDAITNPPLREALAECDSGSPAVESCARAWIGRFGQKVFRRPLGDDEIARYTALFATASATFADVHGGFEYVVAAMLQSPYFLYRAELGTSDPIDPSRRLLGPYELASRLSFFLWNTTPDDELLRAAADGAVTTDEGLVHQVERLARSPRALEAEKQFFAEMLQLGRLDNLPQLAAVYPAATPTFGPSAREETLALVADVIGRDADYGEFFNSTRSFPNREMAAFYGVEPSESAVTMLAGVRSGVLSRAAFLAMNAHASSTSPTKRGKFVREVVLCHSVAPPPPSANVALPVDAPSPVPLTLRERLAAHSVNPACRGCHVALDPIGLGLEEFDGIGAVQAVEAGRAVDTAGRLDEESFAGAAALGALVENRPDLGACLVRNVLRYATGRLEDNGERTVSSALSRNFEAHGRRVPNLLAATALSASFRYAGAPQ